jgi:hypothetical protein
MLYGKFSELEARSASEDVNLVHFLSWSVLAGMQRTDRALSKQTKPQVFTYISFVFLALCTPAEVLISPRLTPVPDCVVQLTFPMQVNNCVLQHPLFSSHAP